MIFTMVINTETYEGVLLMGGTEALVLSKK